MESAQHSDDDELTTAHGNSTSNKSDDSSSHGTTIDPNLSHEIKAGEIPRKLSNVSCIYKQDIVRSKTNSKIGMVTEVAGDSDSDSSITDEDEDEGEKNDLACSKEGDVKNRGSTDKITAESIDGNDLEICPLIADQVRVLWMDESVTTENTNDVTVVDRGFLHGDYVADTSDPMGQIGIVADINITVDLLTHDGSVLKDVSTKDLKRIRDFTVGDHVILGPWLGRIEDVCDNVNVLFDDGSVCKVFKADPLRLIPVGRNILEDRNFPYYPGQCVRASSSSVFKNSRWLSGLWKATRLEGTVTKVTVGSLFIYWIASAGYGPDSATTPAEEQSPKNLKLLSCFAHTKWNLGDWCLIPPFVSESMIPLDRGMSKSEFRYYSKDEPEYTKTAAESDVEVTTSEESTRLSKSMRSGSETSLTKNSDTSQSSAAAESSLGNSVSSDAKGSGQETWPLHRKKIRKVVVRKDKKSQKKVENFERALLIINTKTKLNVSWQDGTINRGLESTSLIPIDTPGDHEFVAEQYAVERAADDGEEGVGTRRIGVVKSVNAKDKTACIRWLKPVPGAEDAREFDKEEVASVYELEGHPDYDYCYGDVVVRFSPVSSSAKVDTSVHSIEDTQLDIPDDSKRDRTQDHESVNAENASATETFAEFSDLSWVGHITGLKDGKVEVTWADGIVSMVGPEAIYVVGRDDDETIAAGSYGSDDSASWETIEDDNVDAIDNVNESLGTVDDTDKRPETEGGNMARDTTGHDGALSVSLSAIGFMTRLASGILSMGQKDSDSSNTGTRSEGKPQSNEVICEDHATDSSSHKPTDAGHENFKPTTETGQEKHNVTMGTDLLGSAEIICDLRPSESDATPQCDEFNSTFKGFDIIQEPSDHYFTGTSGQNNTTRKWLKKVQRDWDILQNHLPEGIYVRVYEDRMDLLRAVVVGAYGTPYQDGLFLFDFLLPPEYPDVPPSAYYHSGGWRINPNLYEEGRVCLSLLNTWTGKGNEVWDPSTSSILQVLVSLQGLVLNSKPYFNEAGYDKQIGTAEGEKNSLGYNENAFLLNCKMMMYLMRRPPKHFEELVVKHFKSRGYYILKACDAYMKGQLIGSLTKDASIITDNNADMNSVGFKLMLGKIIPKLFSSVNEVGADCQEFKHLIQS